MTLNPRGERTHGFARLTALAGNLLAALGRDRVMFGDDSLDSPAGLSTTVVPTTYVCIENEASVRGAIKGGGERSRSRARSSGAAGRGKRFADVRDAVAFLQVFGLGHVCSVGFGK